MLGILLAVRSQGEVVNAGRLVCTSHEPMFVYSLCSAADYITASQKKEG